MTEDANDQQFTSYAECIEMDAKENPTETCLKVLNESVDHFALWSPTQKSDICNAIVSDSAGQQDMCGFLTVNAYQSYIEYYQGLSQKLGTWMQENLATELATVEASASASTEVDSMVDEAMQPDTTTTGTTTEVLA